MKLHKLITMILFLLIIYSYPFAKQPEDDIKHQLQILTIKMEEGFKTVYKMIETTNKRIDDLEKNTNIRFDDINRRIDDKFDAVNKRVDDLQIIMLTGFAILFAMVATLIGFVIGDRRTAISPIARKVKEYAQYNDKMAEVLRNNLTRL